VLPLLETGVERMNLYWRYKKDGKWNWRKVTPEEIQHIVYMEGEEK
jgi:hypothetical protein